MSERFQSEEFAQWTVKSNAESLHTETPTDASDNFIKKVIQPRAGRLRSYTASHGISTENEGENEPLQITQLQETIKRFAKEQLTLENINRTLAAFTACAVAAKSRQMGITVEVDLLSYLPDVLILLYNSEAILNIMPKGRSHENTTFIDEAPI